MRVAITMTSGKLAFDFLVCENTQKEADNRASEHAVQRAALLTFFIKIKTINKILTVFPDSAWTFRYVLQRITLLAGIRACRATFTTFPSTCFRALSGYR
jgi:hypothetical protein